MEKKEQMSFTAQKKILALDVATTTGYCIGYPDKIIDSGIFVLKDKFSTYGIKCRYFEIWLENIMLKHKPDYIVFEMSFGANKAAIIHGSELHGVLKNFCHKAEIDFKGYNPSDIKKFATGKGNSGKPIMIAACMKNYNITPEDDNHADAIHLWHLANRDLNPIHYKDAK